MISLLNLKPFQSDKKVCIIWGLDYINANAAKIAKSIRGAPETDLFHFNRKRPEKNPAYHCF